MLNQSTAGTTADTPQRYSPASGDVDGFGTPLTASAESKGNTMKSMFHLDLMKIGPEDSQPRVEFIHETPDKKAEKKSKLKMKRG